MNKLKILSRLGHGANDIYWFILPASLPLILKEYGLSYTAAGGFVTAFLCAIAVMSFFAGRLADRISRSALLVGGFYLASGALIVAGLSPAFPIFMIFVVLAAIGVSTYHPVIYATIDEGIAVRRGRMYARFEFSGAAGIVLLFVFNGLFSDQIGWRNIVLIASVPGLVVGTLMAFNRSSLEHRAAPAAVPVAPSGGEAEPKKSRELATHRGAGNVVLLFFASIVLRTITATAIMNFMPTFLAEGAGLDVSLGAFAAGLLFIGAMIANSFAGDLADRYGPTRVLLGASLVAGVFLPVSTFTVSVWMLPIALITLGASISAAIPAQNLMLSALSPAGKKGATFGTLMGVMTVANSLGPLVLGAMADRVGLAVTFRLAAFPVIASCAFVAAVARKGLPEGSGRRLSGSAA